MEDGGCPADVPTSSVGRRMESGEKRRRPADRRAKKVRLEAKTISSGTGSAQRPKHRSRKGRATEQVILPGLKLVRDIPWRIVADSIEVLRAALGDELLAAFARCFSAADRMMTIYDCILLNSKHCKKDSIRRMRNHYTLGLFSVGLVVEFQDGIAALRRAGVAMR